MANDVKTYLPTKKWWATLVGGVVPILIHWLQTGEFDDTERGSLAALGVALVTAYFKRNDSTPEGVPVKSV